MRSRIVAPDVRSRIVAARFARVNAARPNYTALMEHTAGDSRDRDRTEGLSETESMRPLTRREKAVSDESKSPTENSDSAQPTEQTTTSHRGGHGETERASRTSPHKDSSGTTQRATSKAAQPRKAGSATQKAAVVNDEKKTPAPGGKNAPERDEAEYETTVIEPIGEHGMVGHPEIFTADGVKKPERTSADIGAGSEKSGSGKGGDASKQDADASDLDGVGSEPGDRDVAGENEVPRGAEAATAGALAEAFAEDADGKNGNEEPALEAAPEHPELEAGTDRPELEAGSTAGQKRGAPELTTPISQGMKSTKDAPRDKKTQGKSAHGKNRGKSRGYATASKLGDLAAPTIDLVEKWLAESKQYPADASAERLAGVLRDPNGLEFTMGFVDRVVRPEDSYVAGQALAELTSITPKFLPAPMRAAISVGGFVGRGVPWAVVPVAQRVLRQMVSHLIVDATPSKLGEGIKKLRANGNRLNINLLGEAVLGEKEASKRLQGTRELLERDDVDYVSIKVSSVVSQLQMWAFDEAVEKIVERLTPLYELAANSPTPKFINLDMEEYKDLDLTLAVFQRILEQPQLRGLEAGIVLQAYLPDALGALQRLTSWAQQRRAEGGAPIKVRVVKGANLAMENVDHEIHDWPQAPYSTKQDTDTNYKRVLNWAFEPAHVDAVRIGVAGHNLFDIAFAHLLAKQRGVEDSIEFEMLLGMATEQAQAIRKDVGQLLLYTPVVHPGEFDVAIAYLVRRLEENASSENFMSAVFDLADSDELFEREKNRFLDSLAVVTMDTPERNRQQNRATEWTVEGDAGERKRVSITEEDTTEWDFASTGFQNPGLTNIALGIARGTASRDVNFRNEPDTDPSLPENREWARKILSRVEGSKLGLDILDDNAIETQDELDAVIEKVKNAQRSWGEMSGAERGRILHRAGLALSANRDRLLEVAATETGKTIGEGDPEVSEAIDFAHYYAELAGKLDEMQGAKFVPSTLTVVVPPWNFPIAIPAGGMLAALAAGSGVVVKPAPQSRRTAAIVVDTLWEAGIPRDLLQIVDFRDAENGEGDLAKNLISSKEADRVILTGSTDAARLFRSWRPDLQLLAETSGKNSIIVTPSADLDLAAADVVKSAFGHAGQKCSAASLVILVGSVARSKRFMGQLKDAAESMRVGYPTDPVTQMGPIIEPASGKLKQALTTLGGGESWLVEPKQLDETGRLWSPGVRTGVQPGSYFHLTEFFGPVLGVMHAPTVADAIRLQNATEFGLTAGLHSLEPKEIDFWLEHVQAGNLYINRGITGAIVQRQPFGGWKRSAVGAGTKAGGPSYLFGLGSWVDNPGEESTTLHLRGLDQRVVELIESAQQFLPFEEFDLLRRSALSGQIAYNEEFGLAHDPSKLSVERNLLRYRPVPAMIRAAEGASLLDLLRVIVAARTARVRPSVSAALEVPEPIATSLWRHDVHVVRESDAEFAARMKRDGVPQNRIRLVAAEGEQDAARTALSEALDGNPDVAIYAWPATTAGRIELLPFVREQAVSITAHRFGNPHDPSEGLI